MERSVMVAVFGIAWTCVIAVWAGEQGASDVFVQRYDSNGNGRIDIEGRQGYVRERARWVREEAKREAALRPVVPLEMRILLGPAEWTKEKLAEYDTNKNGRLEPGERAQERRDAVKTAEERFRKADGNRDGHLDAKERQAALRLQAEDTGP